MKKYLFILFFLFPALTHAQKLPVDSLRQALLIAKEDTTKIALLQMLARQYFPAKPDSSLIFCRQGLALATQGKLPRWEAGMRMRISRALGQFPGKKDSALEYMHQAMALAKQHSFIDVETGCYHNLSQMYLLNWKKPDSALLVCLDGLLISKKNNLPDDEMGFGYRVYSILVPIKSVDSIRLLKGKVVAWAKKNKQEVEMYDGLFLNADGSRNMDLNNYPEALKSFFAAIRIFEKVHADQELADDLKIIGEIYYKLAEYERSLSYYSQALVLYEKLKYPYLGPTYHRLGSIYAKLKMTDSAIFFAKKSYVEAERTNGGHVPGLMLDDIAEMYADIGQDSIAMYYFRRALPEIQPNTDYYESNRAEINIGIAKLFRNAGQNDSSFYYARLALPFAQKALLQGYSKELLLGYVYEASNIMSSFYKSKRQSDSAFFYQEIAIAAKDSLLNQEKIREARNIEFNEQLRQEQAKETEAKYRNRINSYFFVSGLLVVLLIAVFLYRNNRLKQKANLILQEQKQKVENALEQVRSAQGQLIQSEKMASLGELTAGIAHEIQNPLNFVNNFSEVNGELISELESERSKVKSERSEDLENEIINDIKQNLEKINHHGKRADAIVKGMLQHSRTSSGQKEMTDINSLADEYLRLAYHGLRAKDKNFNADFKIDFDPSIGKINIIPQDIGRVLLNLINNAFYAVGERQKVEGTGYEPTVTISTKKLNDKVEIKVQDNGNGIPQKILDKIFQPFFTTKPTGQGTGLGLSLAYDIVKTHGGELKVETREAKGSDFNVILPQNNPS